MQKGRKVVEVEQSSLSTRWEAEHASSTINTNQHTITNIHRQRNKTHSSIFLVGFRSLVDRRKPTLAAASASWSFFVSASSRCTCDRVIFGCRGLVGGLGRLRVGLAALLFAFLRGGDDGDDDGEARLRLRGDALSCLFGLGFLSAGYSRTRCLPCQILAWVRSCTNFLTAYLLRPLVISFSRTFSGSNCAQECMLLKLVSMLFTMPDVRRAI
jgi:hypothetical protein